MSMLISYKTEIDPTDDQAGKMNQTIGTCRFIYNFYLAENKERYESDKKFLSGKDFSKWLNNEFLPNHPDYHWIKDAGSKAVKQSIMNGDKAFRRFLTRSPGFPDSKRKTNPM